MLTAIGTMALTSGLGSLTLPACSVSAFGYPSGEELGGPPDSEIFFFLPFVLFLGLHLWHMGVPRARVESELQLPAYTTATATRAQSDL